MALISSVSTNTTGTGKAILCGIALHIDNSDFIFHNNFIRGRFAKELRFKEMKLYSCDINGEYSGEQKYMTVEELHSRRIVCNAMSTRSHVN